MRHRNTLLGCALLGATILVAWAVCRQEEVALSSHDDLKYAPPSFKIGEQAIVPIDIHESHVRLEFHLDDNRFDVETRLNFHTNEPGSPMLLLRPDPTEVHLGQAHKPLSPVKTRMTTPHEGKTKAKYVSDVRVIGSDVEPYTAYTLEVSRRAKLTTSQLEVHEVGKISWAWFMVDTVECIDRSKCDPSKAWLLDRYVPANFEFDQFTLNLVVSLLSSDLAPHYLFVGGRSTPRHLTSTSPTTQITLPGTNSASPYLHMVPTDHIVAHDSCVRVSRGPVVQVYETSSESIDESKRSSPQRYPRVCPPESSGLDVCCRATDHLTTLEDLTNIRYPHGNGLVVYLERNTGSPTGMEYAGAFTMAGTPDPGEFDRILLHEVAHQWFGRFLVPATGRDAWIDEVIADTISLNPGADISPRTFACDIRADLDAGSIYSRYTPSAVYDHAEDLFMVLAIIGKADPLYDFKSLVPRLLSDNRVMRAARFRDIVVSQFQLHRRSTARAILAYKLDHGKLNCGRSMKERWAPYILGPNLAAVWENLRKTTAARSLRPYVPNL